MNSTKIQITSILLFAFGMVTCLFFIFQSNNTLLSEGSKGFLVILSVAAFKIASKNTLVEK